MTTNMDFHERKVLRRKAPLIGATLGFSCAAQKLYLQQNILNDDNIAEVMVRLEFTRADPNFPHQKCQEAKET